MQETQEMPVPSLGQEDSLEEEIVKVFSGVSDSMDTSLSKPWELVMDREAWRAAVYGLQRVSQTRLSD